LSLNGGQRRDLTADAGLFRAGLACQPKQSKATPHWQIAQGSFSNEITLALRGI
jgi:negative regulator of replication initiation